MTSRVASVLDIAGVIVIRNLHRNIKRTYARWRLCRSLHFRHGTPDLCLIAYANMLGTAEDKLLAQYLV